MEIYHVLNRGVDKRNVVNDDNDRFRFVHSLYIFNDSKPLDENHTRTDYFKAAIERVPLVDIHAWCLMDNHYHLLVSPIDDDLKNLATFMKKLNMGYARYFNERNHRSGYLWQGKYKKILIEQDSHFLHIPYYIHLNPLDRLSKDWRSGPVSDIQCSLEYLTKYRWSSHLDYIGERNFSSVINNELLTETLGSPEKYISAVNKYLSMDMRAEQQIRLE
ncbi:MAG: hypothetical protein COU10_03935 [Candidatus Harrisonbacteria bacterium CG10_big_fil_rev_8_21_14_0_10_45_28]|uniref:Transposase IS200-like domain-containing protein n=1 Tax=Candidatus Harrisonbacteria bacterium CG10_big_fil_rev_8_21_14_0_10_45_28 TaxID=1974586 RepID=A0A2H0UMG2_9BACT|nr:MAG: hypothetical protein COU10_03935 [Candidatus Harrisonbacteria bacterium CG10_big_fil_rev_8_21_14_0_10_45_28]